MGIRAVSPKRRADYGSSPSDRTVIAGFFDERELEIFSELIQHRCHLPIFHGDFWRCYDCGFESEDFEKLAEHILKAHKSASLNMRNYPQQEFAEV
ncbi:MAG: hypothetical protein ABSB91_00130 [Sedimentisphaerales bacterium]